MVNHILNITIVDDFLNKREIGATRPSVYMKRFKRENEDLARTMKTHLITDIDQFGIFEDDYNTFLEQRAKIVSKELSKRIIRNDAIDGNIPDIRDDYEEDAD